MSNIVSPDIISKSLSSSTANKTFNNKVFADEDHLLSRYQREFSIREAKRLIDSVDYLGDFKLKSKHAFLLRILLDRYKYGCPVLDSQQKNCFPSMRVIKKAMKCKTDNKNTTPDIARRDLENQGLLEVTRNLREQNNQNANNVFRLTEKFFLYYVLFRVEHEKTILTDSNHQEQNDYYKSLNKTETLAKIKIEKINLERSNIQPVERILGTLGSLKKKLKAINAEISETAIQGKFVSPEIIKIKRQKVLNFYEYEFPKYP